MRNKNAEHPTYITTTFGGAGYFAVMLWWNPDLGGFYEPWESGWGRYATQEEAAEEGREWATLDGIEFRQPPPEQYDSHVHAYRRMLLRAKLNNRRANA